jgi:hypothetical protein
VRTFGLNSEILGRSGGGRGIGNVNVPHAARLGGDAVQKVCGSVSGQKVHQLRLVDCADGAVYKCGQLSQLCSSWCGEAICGVRAEIWETAANVPACRKCSSVRGCKDG